MLTDCQSKNVDIDFIQGLERKFLQKTEAQKKRILLELDDLFNEAAQSKDFLALVVAGRHRNVHLMVLRHNLFQQTKTSKTIDFNVTRKFFSTALEILNRLVFWVVNWESDTPQWRPIKSYSEIFRSLDD